MQNVGISQQTLQEFIDAPFGIPNKQKNLQYETKYRSFRDSHKIQVEATIEFEKNYFIHVKVPSESTNGKTYYDVVVQFFTPNERVEKEVTIQNYYVQFFSNSPGFIYKYAALYKLNGYLIESLCDKFESGTLDILPDKANKNYELYFDSSIYYACRYILDNKLTMLGKSNIMTFKTKTPSSFFRDIQDVESSSISRSITNLEASIKKEIAKDTKLSKEQEKKIKEKPHLRNLLFGKKSSKGASKSTLKDKGDSSVKYIKPKKSSNKSGKKVAKRTT